MPLEHELWITALLNKLIGGPVAVLLVKLGLHPDPAHPIPNQIAMELLVIAVIVIGALILRPRLSVENPGTFQQMMEVVVRFTQDMTDEMIGHGGRRYVALIGTLGIFVGLCNLLGLVPTLGTATASIDVTLGCSLVCFLHYNYQGFREHGIIGYLKHLCGPMMAIAVLMFPIEVFSNAFRLLSLSVRLWANMLVGDILESVFTSLVPVLVPALFMALHIFVSLLQAYVFMILPAVYISLAVAEEH